MSKLPPRTTPTALASPPSTPGSPVFRSLFDELLQRIRRGDWLPGERLPSIPHLARQLGVSTGSLREALRSLQSMGVVKIEHGRGVFVTGAAPPDVASHFQDVSVGVLLALAETRRILEPELAALAAVRGSEEELTTIMRLAQQMEQDTLRGIDSVEPDTQFHHCIAEAARNPVLFRMMESVNELFLQSRVVTAREPGLPARTVRYHLLIAEALCERNAAQARLLMLAHMNDALDSLLVVDQTNVER